jgi:hypothetical protein
MKWIASVPPHWVWKGDKWERYPNSKLFEADLDKKEWVAPDETIPFPKDCIIEHKHHPKEIIEEKIS